MGSGNAEELYEDLDELCSEDVIDDGDNEKFREPKHAIKCRCPRCGKMHLLRVFWTGTGTPRIYCHRCRAVVEDMCASGIYENQPILFAASRRSRAATD